MQTFAISICQSTPDITELFQFKAFPFKNYLKTYSVYNKKKKKKKTENYVLQQNYVLRRQKENNIVTRKWHKNKTNYSTEIPGCIHDARNKSNYANSINFLDNNIFRIVKFHS